MINRPSKTRALDCQSMWRTAGAGVSPARRSIALIAVAAICMFAAFASAQNRLSESDVKAAYLFNFGKFVRFAPSDALTKRQSFDICIVGEDPFGHTLNDLTANEQLDGKPVRVLRLRTAAEARECAIAYISASEGTRMGTDLDALHGQSVLTVSDAANFIQNGGMIQLVVAANHVRFSVNLGAVQSAQLGLSSELLRVAVSVNGKPPAEVQP